MPSPLLPILEHTSLNHWIPPPPSSTTTLIMLMEESANSILTSTSSRTPSFPNHKPVLLTPKLNSILLKDNLLMTEPALLMLTKTSLTKTPPSTTSPPDTRLLSRKFLMNTQLSSMLNKSSTTPEPTSKLDFIHQISCLQLKIIS